MPSILYHCYMRAGFLMCPNYIAFYMCMSIYMCNEYYAGFIAKNINHNQSLLQIRRFIYTICSYHKKLKKKKKKIVIVSEATKASC